MLCDNKYRVNFAKEANKVDRQDLDKTVLGNIEILIALDPII